MNAVEQQYREVGQVGGTNPFPPVGVASKEKVLSVYPDAYCVKYHEAALGELYRVFTANGEAISALCFQSPEVAWGDAALKLCALSELAEK